MQDSVCEVYLCKDVFPLHTCPSFRCEEILNLLKIEVWRKVAWFHRSLDFWCNIWQKAGINSMNPSCLVSVDQSDGGVMV